MSDFPTVVNAYIGSDSDNMFELAQEIGLDKEASEKFMLALYEVKFELLVNEDGSYEIIGISETGAS